MYFAIGGFFPHLRKGRFGCLKMYEEEARAMIEEENFTDDIDVDLLIDNKKIPNRQI